MTTLGSRISKRLVALGHDPESGGQTWLAKRVGMTQQGVEAILKGRSKRPRLLKEIAKALGTSQEYLLGETEDPGTANLASPKVLRIIEKILDAHLPDLDADFLDYQVDLLLRPRRDRSSDSQDNEQQPKD